MIRSRAMSLLAMALLVAVTGFTARAYAQDAPQAETVDTQDCAHDGGWFDPDLGMCELEAP